MCILIIIAIIYFLVRSSNLWVTYKNCGEWSHTNFQREAVEIEVMKLEFNNYYTFYRLSAKLSQAVRFL